MKHNERTCSNMHHIKRRRQTRTDEDTQTTTDEDGINRTAQATGVNEDRQTRADERRGQTDAHRQTRVDERRGKGNDDE